MGQEVGEGEGLYFKNSVQYCGGELRGMHIMGVFVVYVICVLFDPTSRLQRSISEILRPNIEVVSFRLKIKTSIIKSSKLREIKCFD